MYQTIDKAKLADAQSVADKLEKLPERVLLYIAGYVECALDMTGKLAGAERDSARQDEAREGMGSWREK